MGGGQAAGPAPVARLGHQPEHRAQGRLVAALGDGERDDPGRRGGEQFDDRVGILRRITEVDDGADDPRFPRAVGVSEGQRVQMVLVAQCVAHLLVARQHADTADAPVSREPGVEQPVDVAGLVGTVKAADTEMRYADADLAAVIGRDGDVETGQVPCVQLHSSVTLARTPLRLAHC